MRTDGAGVAGGVVAEVPHGPPQLVGPAPHVNRRRPSTSTATEEPARRSARDPQRDLLEVDHAAIGGPVDLVAAGELEQVVDEALHPECLVEDQPVRGERVGAIGVGEVDLELRAHAGERSSQLVGRVGDEALLALRCGLGVGDEAPDEDPERGAEHQGGDRDRDGEGGAEGRGALVDVVEGGGDVDDHVAVAAVDRSERTRKSSSSKGSPWTVRTTSSSAGVGPIGGTPSRLADDRTTRPSTTTWNAASSSPNPMSAGPAASPGTQVGGGLLQGLLEVVDQDGPVHAGDRPRRAGEHHQHEGARHQRSRGGGAAGSGGGQPASSTSR